MPGGKGRIKQGLRHGWDTWCGNLVPQGLARRNWRLSLAMQAAWSWFLGTSIMATYYTEVMHLSQLQVYLLQTTWAVIATLGTIPAGWLADRYGLRRVMICGTAVHLGQSIFFAFCTQDWQFEIALALAGVQVAMLGGSTETLVATSLRRVMPDRRAERQLRFKEYQHAALRARSFMGVVGMLLGNFLGTQINMRLPFILQGFVYLVPLVAAWKCTEPREPAHHLSLDDIIKRMRIMMVDRPMIRWTVVSYVTTGATTIAGFWLVQPLMRGASIPIALFGWIYAAQALCIGVLSWPLQRLGTKHPVVMWGSLALAAGGGSLAAGLNLGIASPILLLLCFSLARAGMMPFIQSHLAKELEEDEQTRATDLSIVDSVQTLVFAVIGPIVGGIASMTSIYVAFLALGGGCLIFNCVALLELRRAPRQP